MQNKVIGIVGGMGSEAGIALYQRILANTHARTDQEHLSTILMSFPELIADRTAFLMGDTSINPAYEVVNVIDRLARAGAEVVGIACNTSHVSEIFDVIVEGTLHLSRPVRLLNMPFEVSDHLKVQVTNGSRVGVLMTNGTYHSGLYGKVVEEAGCIPVIPDQTFQKHVVHKMIYDPEIGIKANFGLLKPATRDLFKRAMEFFIDASCEAVILGCTELSLTGDLQKHYPLRYVDSTECMARALIRAATDGQEIKRRDHRLVEVSQ